MAVFEPATSMTLGRFAERLGVPFRPAADGSVSFRFERSGTLTATPSDDGRSVVLSLAHRPDRPAEQAEWTLLNSAGHDTMLNRFVHAGLDRDGGYHWAVIIANDELSEQLVERCLERLIDIRRAVA
jgi:hypothetical protein